MGWFEEQIKLRCEKDSEALDEALQDASAMIRGKRRQTFDGDRERIKSALDEATGALDNITQKKVSAALDSLKCTRIVVAHRLSTIRQCDRIILLDGGKIAEDGTYEELLAKKGSFYELVERQRLNT